MVEEEGKMMLSHCKIVYILILDAEIYIGKYNSYTKTVCKLCFGFTNR